MVNLIVDCDDISEKPDSYYMQFDIVCITRVSCNQLVKINNICHHNNIQFYAGDVYGTYGFMFSDLQEHRFVE